MANTIVTATVTGADNQPFANGTFLASLTNSAGVSFDALPYTSQLASVPVTEFSGVLDSTGSFTIALAPNSLVTGSFWQFTVRSNGTGDVLTYLATITGATQDLTVPLSSLALMGSNGSLINNVTLAYVDSFNPISIKSPLTQWRLALSNVGTGVSDAKLLFVGDSTTAGTGSGNASEPLGSYPAKLVSSLFTNVPCANGLGVPSDGNPDNRWTLGTNWSLLSITPPHNIGFGGIAAYAGTASGGNLVFTPGTGASYDSFDIYYINNTASTRATVTGTGGTPLVLSTVNATSIQKATVTCASAATSNALTVNAVTGATFLVIGVEPFLSTTPRVRFANAGISGSTTSQWVAAGSGSWNGVFSIQAYNPDLTVISLGINDATALTTTATYIANITSLINAAQFGGGSVILMTWPPSSPAAQIAAFKGYYPALLALANNLNIPVIDIFARWNKTYQASFMSDIKHPNNLGYFDWANMIVPYLQH